MKSKTTITTETWNTTVVTRTSIGPSVGGSDSTTEAELSTEVPIANPRQMPPMDDTHEVENEH